MILSSLSKPQKSGSWYIDMFANFIVSGGCGACVVLLSKYNPILDQLDDCTVSSCLTLLCSVNGCSITTTEGLGNSKDGFHPIHERFSGFHASQCGFCTPGMCMSLFSALVNAEKTPGQSPLWDSPSWKFLKRKGLLQEISAAVLGTGPLLMPVKVLQQMLIWRIWGLIPFGERGIVKKWN